MNPTELLYAPSHEWVHVGKENGERIATIGISAFAVNQLNDLVYMDLSEPGKSVSVGDEFGEVESVKAVSPLYSPVDGEIVAVNTELPDHLDRLSEDPYGRGWLIKVRLSSDQGLSNLLDHDAYEKQCAAEG